MFKKKTNKDWRSWWTPRARIVIGSEIVTGSEIQIFRVKQMKHSALPSHFITRIYLQSMKSTDPNFLSQTFWKLQTSVELFPAFYKLKIKILMMMNTREICNSIHYFRCVRWLSVTRSCLELSKFLSRLSLCRKLASLSLLRLLCLFLSPPTYRTSPPCLLGLLTLCLSSNSLLFLSLMSRSSLESLLLLLLLLRMSLTLLEFLSFSPPSKLCKFWSSFMSLSVLVFQSCFFLSSTFHWFPSSWDLLSLWTLVCRDSSANSNWPCLLVSGIRSIPSRSSALALAPRVLSLQFSSWLLFWDCLQITSDTCPPSHFSALRSFSSSGTKFGVIPLALIPSGRTLLLSWSLILPTVVGAGAAMLARMLGNPFPRDCFKRAFLRKPSVIINSRLSQNRTENSRKERAYKY